MNNSTVQTKQHTSRAKPAKKQQGKKQAAVEPAHPELLIKVLKDLYVFDQIKIVSTHAPIIDLTAEDLKSAIITANPIDSDIIHNSVVRVHKDAKGKLHILTGKSTAMMAIEEGAPVIKARLISRSALWRTMVPQDELVRQKLHDLASVGGKNGIRIVDSQSKAKAVPKSTVATPKAEKKQTSASH